MRRFAQNRLAVTTLALLVAATMLASCTSDGPVPLPPLPDEPATVLGLAEGRPATITVPSDYDPSTFYPIVFVLHGYDSTGLVLELYFQTIRQVFAEQIILVVPEGTTDQSGSQFWNATPRCCDNDDSGVDDEGYLRGLIAEAQANYRVDPGRVYLTGHSNGGDMGYRMACTSSDLITAIVAFTGGTFENAEDCPAEQPVSVLHVHGTEDSAVPYDGITTTDGTGLPSAPEAVRRFAERAGCDVDNPTLEPNLDLDFTIDGAETEVVAYREGCQDGVDAELWSIVGAPHLPAITATDFTSRAIRWLKQHSR